ncbi:MAG: DUF3006 domain-containing protein [Atopostipes suicloacalis]|nr:DUF3006 domain-containing protein [Atopostipes suicloacalis]MDN6730817.1 DUF3006 domain-containing protein [Atopostipes suicloacalis]
MEVIVDRFEGDYAVCETENREMKDIPKEKLPKGVKEGDVLVITDEGISIHPAKRKEREQRINDLMNDLWED